MNAHDQPEELDAWVREHLVCPRDHSDLTIEAGALACAHGHRYPYVDGIPIMLRDDVPATHVEYARTLARVREAQAEPSRAEQPATAEGVDPYVQEAVAGTCGNMYRRLIRTLTSYPIPVLRLPPGEGRRFLDIGCGWGRWCISAARQGYAVVGIDPSLEAIRAGRRVARQLGLPISYLVADGRYLPFRDRSFDVIFSYSVLQHFDKQDARQGLSEVSRTMRAAGMSLIQMPNTFGLRNLYNQLRRGFAATAFEVRYWQPGELRTTFTSLIGPSDLLVDGFFSLNPQTSDLRLLPSPYRLVVMCSEFLRRGSDRLPWLAYFADSLYVRSTRSDDLGPT